MSDAEVALELTKIIMASKDWELDHINSKTSKDDVLSLFRECRSAVQANVSAQG